MSLTGSCLSAIKFKHQKLISNCCELPRHRDSTSEVGKNRWLELSGKDFDVELRRRAVLEPMCGEGQDLLSIPEQSRSVKPAGVNGLATVRMAASGTGSRIFSRYVTHDGSSRMKLVLERKTFGLPTKRQERPDGSGDSPKKRSKTRVKNVRNNQKHFSTISTRRFFNSEYFSTRNQKVSGSGVKFLRLKITSGSP